MVGILQTIGKLGLAYLIVGILVVVAYIICIFRLSFKDETEKLVKYLTNVMNTVASFRGSGVRFDEKMVGQTIEEDERCATPKNIIGGICVIILAWPMFAMHFGDLM